MHRSKESRCDACTALGRVASVVVDDRTSEELRKYAARALEKAYTKILERGLELLQRGGGKEEEAPVREPANPLLDLVLLSHQQSPVRP